MPLSANRVWRQLPNETRVSASELFWAGPGNGQKQLIIGALAKAKNVREVSVRRAPVERLINWTAATLTLPDQIVVGLLQDYLLKAHREVIVKYLDLLGIPHTDANDRGGLRCRLRAERAHPGWCSNSAGIGRSPRGRTLPEVPRGSRWALGRDRGSSASRGVKKLNSPSVSLEWRA